MRKNSNNETELPLTISSKDGLVDQVTFFNKKVSSKDMSGYYLLKNGEFAYNKSYSNGYDFGSIKRLERYEMGALSTLYICFSLKKHCSDYIKHYFDSLKWYRQIYVISAEGARNHGLLNVPTDDFFATTHFLSSDINEQQKIADFLSLVDQCIEKQRQLVEALKKYKRGLLSAIFDRKIRFKDDNGNNFPDWELKTVADVLNYEQPQKYIVFSENYNDEYKTPVLTANKAFILGYTNEETGVYSKGETIIYDDFTMDFKFVDFSFKVKSSTIKMLTCKNFNDLYFMYNLLLSLNLMPQSHQRSYISILEPTKIFVPCYDEQLIISKVLRKVDSYVDQHNKYLDTLEKCKKGLLQQMFI